MTAAPTRFGAMLKRPALVGDRRMMCRACRGQGGGGAACGDTPCGAVAAQHSRGLPSAKRNTHAHSKIERCRAETEIETAD
eukprot:11878688-Alexandrium_andersonii.AAC.1